MPALPKSGETILGVNHLVPCLYFEHTEPNAMAALFANDSEQIDGRTSRSIRDAVGERLQQRLRPETQLPTHLEQLMNELRQRDRDQH
ncbi:hypothetical protein [Bradyrhizobium symbiodeficiens]|uniref:Uncharacterized protein n=1 Tax=Bradyrhizobium symbiodeficiens TaxID=1404367 RepID=A0A6G9ACN7_9BRAD|nr:hypothetical protein [Bradyrhizobium symbiodeficiens]